MADDSIALEQLQRFRDGHAGYCIKCQLWTATGVEPDAQEYICPICGEQSVYGAEEAFREGIVDDEGQASQ